ncbi:hypothetical protein PHLGIDRAFT_123288 [Phlebiopsis gigantea 11061_1 CR5-6]|uniref:Uncharacterized protein n=1 Tax=Phlebiopsis gigantea (strain 11061_1 CR5-6) TaxID=745531 RepID=A0A0C3RPN3_PHLG1|nr:hypothetical protein PHLGIDRAFT_123288 [Phlebiopsis gigantea 11061_1 CR5-6]
MPIFLSYGSAIPTLFANILFKQYAPPQTIIDYFDQRLRNPSSHPVHPRASQDDFLQWLQSQESSSKANTPRLPSSTDSFPMCSVQIESQEKGPSTADPEAPRPPEGSRQKQGQRPEDFFEEQRLLRERRIAQESLAQRSIREEREREQNSLEFPTRRGPRVFVWVSTHMNGNNYWARSLCSASRHSELWKTTSRVMRIYHSAINEWDVWSGLDPDWVADDDEWSGEEEEKEGSSLGRAVGTRDQGNIASSFQPSNAHRRSMSPQRRTESPRKRSRSPISRHHNLPPLLSFQEMEELYRSQLQSDSSFSMYAPEIDPASSVFTYRYGLFINPEYTPAPPRSSKVKEATVGRSWSFHRIRDDIPPDWYPYVLDFTSRILEKSPLPPLLTSLATGIRHPNRSRITAVRVTQAVMSSSAESSGVREDQSVKRVYLVEGLGSDDLPWALVIPSATTAAQILRSAWGPDKKGIIDQLLSRGISFHIMLRSLQSAHRRGYSAADDAGVHGGLGWPRFSRVTPMHA